MEAHQTTVEANEGGNIIRCHGLGYWEATCNNNNRGSSDSWWDRAISSLPSNVYGYLKMTKVPGDGLALAHTILTGNGKMVSDGSFDPISRIGTCAYRIENTDRRILAQGVCRVPGSKEDMNSYRAELMGIYLMLRTLEAMCAFFSITKGHITIACDNKTGLDKSMNLLLHPTSKFKHYDLLQEIYMVRKNLPIKFTVTHVKGHQTEEDRRFCQLSEMNHSMDSLAKEYLQHFKRFGSRVSNEFSHKNWTIWLGETKIIEQIDKHVTSWIHGRDLKKYWISKGRFSEDIINIIDWLAMEDRNKDRTNADAMWATKLDSHFLPVAGRLHMMGEWESPMCKICKNSDENIEHLFTCRHPEAQEIRTEAQINLIEWLTHSNTYPDISSVIIRWEISPWDVKMEKFLHLTEDSDVKEAIIHQDLIVRIDSLAGKWSIKWRDAQRKYGIKSGNKQYSGRRWAAAFNSQIRLYGKTIWKHRSAKIHEHDYVESQAKLAEELTNQIEKEFNTGTDGLRAVDRHLVTNTDAKSLK